MNWNNHSNLVGQHASLLGASKCSWLNYSDEKVATTYRNVLAAERGTALHELACNAIRLGVKIKDPKTIAMYVNDAIGYGMTPEQPLVYSLNAFGTADAIKFKKNFLRIHDLKTGVSVPHREQLDIYAALFCLEYQIKPGNIRIENRIYQNADVDIWCPEADTIVPIMDKIVRFDKIIDKIKYEGDM